MLVRLFIAVAMILLTSAAEVPNAAFAENDPGAIRQLIAETPCSRIDLYTKEFARPDQKPFGKSQADWTQDDYDALHDRLQSCMNSWTRSNAAQFYMDNVNAELHRFQQEEMQRLQLAQQRKDQEIAAQQHREQLKVAQRQQLQQIEAQEKVARANDEIRQKQHEIDNARAAARIDEHIVSLEGFAEEINRLPDTTESKKRLAQISDSAVSFWRDRSSIIDFHIAPDRLQKFDALTALVSQKVKQKDRGIALAEANLRSVAFNKRADAAAIAHGKKIADLHFPADYLGSNIVLEPGRQFIPLRSYIGLLLNRPNIIVTEKAFGADAGVGVKAPNRETTYFVFRMDGGELFLTEIVVGDRSFPVVTDVDRGQAAALLRSAIGSGSIDVPG